MFDSCGATQHVGPLDTFAVLKNAPETRAGLLKSSYVSTASN